MGCVLGRILRQFPVEEPEETAVVIVQVVDQLVGIVRARRVRGHARLGIALGVVAEQRGPAEHQQRRIVHEVQHGKQTVKRVNHSFPMTKYKKGTKTNGRGTTRVGLMNVKDQNDWYLNCLYTNIVDNSTLFFIFFTIDALKFNKNIL